MQLNLPHPIHQCTGKVYLWLNNIIIFLTGSNNWLVWLLGRMPTLECQEETENFGWTVRLEQWSLWWDQEWNIALISNFSYSFVHSFLNEPALGTSAFLISSSRAIVTDSLFSLSMTILLVLVYTSWLSQNLQNYATHEIFIKITCLWILRELFFMPGLVGGVLYVEIFKNPI